MHAALAADARLLGAAERRAQVAQEPRIDPADAHVQRRAQAMGRADVAGPYGRGQAVRRSVGQGNGFLFRIERRDVAARPENFLLDDGGRFRQACPHGGLDPGARGQPVRHVRHAAARHHRRALFAGAGVVAQHLVAMALRNQGAQVHAGVLGPSQLETPRPLAQRRDEALEDGPLHIDALGAQADLPRVVERGTGDARHGAIG
ncbi:hypothetical protein G6F57_019719 [Rhizopus arrhizus]|nr:hypothetical protein G6F57_019719 [Rhizopus arrhizus]